MGDPTTPSETVTRKPDSDVGEPGSPAVGGGRQTPEQAAITDIGDGGRSDADRDHTWRAPEGQAGRAPAPTGGASGGHADQNSARGGDGKVAHGHYKVEKERT